MASTIVQRADLTLCGNDIYRYLLEIEMIVLFSISRAALATFKNTISSESGHTFVALCRPLF